MWLISVQTLGKLLETQLSCCLQFEEKMGLMFSACNLVTGEELATEEVDEATSFLSISEQKN